jgi:hypothetical protein
MGMKVKIWCEFNVHKLFWTSVVIDMSNRMSPQVIYNGSCIRDYKYTKIGAYLRALNKLREYKRAVRRLRRK